MSSRPIRVAINGFGRIGRTLLRILLRDAPDIELERLDAHGARSGEMVKLSSYFGRPVGLIFGSYT